MADVLRFDRKTTHRLYRVKDGVTFVVQAHASGLFPAVQHRMSHEAEWETLPDWQFELPPGTHSIRLIFEGVAGEPSTTALNEIRRYERIHYPDGFQFTGAAH